MFHSFVKDKFEIYSKHRNLPLPVRQAERDFFSLDWDTGSQNIVVQTNWKCLKEAMTKKKKMSRVMFQSSTGCRLKNLISYYVKTTGTHSNPFKGVTIIFRLYLKNWFLSQKMSHYVTSHCFIFYCLPWPMCWEISKKKRDF